VIDKLHFSIEDHHKSGEFLIYDLAGREVLKGICEEQKETILDVRHLKNGVYSLLIRNSDNFGQFVFIKQ